MSLTINTETVVNYTGFGHKDYTCTLESEKTYIFETLQHEDASFDTFIELLKGDTSLALADDIDREKLFLRMMYHKCR